MTTNGIRHSSHLHSELAVQGLTGAKTLGGHALAISLRGRRYPLNPDWGAGTLVELRASLHVRSQAGVLMRVCAPVTLAYPSSPQGDEFGRTDIAATVDLSAESVAAMERHRDGKNLHINLTIRGTAWYPHLRFAWIEGDVSHGVPIDDWIRVLSEMDYSHSVLVEIPISSPADADLQRAAQHLQAARTALLRGEYRNAVGRCRAVYEVMEQRTGDRMTWGQIKALAANGRSLDKAERAFVLKAAAKNLTHPANHAGTQDVLWSREDANAIVAVTSALLAWAAG